MKRSNLRTGNDFHHNSKLKDTGGVVKVDIYEVDTKIELKVNTFLLGL